ncbi:DNA replication initiation control protein YabA [Streptococcus oricebi]|uniref:Replication initiation control protein YabA n=1 Tax=Streptococcus oricebi TaxID=1547447 RepID=A0ABS5B3E3_9STRE|nr:DNA replication initiation control protein YabA [Streptococcus oricebi]MBP2623350.1 DNA replication initiation control protein YabA [Streptococcus oricebi]
MNKKDLFDALDDFSQSLLLTLAEVEAIKKNLQAVVEENTSLRLENDKLRQHLGEVEHTMPTRTSQGRDNLEKIYLDGFHVCTDFYGQRRDNDEEECAFCNELLFRE